MREEATMSDNRRVKCKDCGETLRRIPGTDRWMNPGGYAACLAGGRPHPHRPEPNDEG